MNGLARVAGGARPLRRLPPWNRHRFAACVAAIAAAWMAMLGARYVALGYADVRGGLGLGVGDGSWLSTAYAVGDVVGVVLGCWLATALSLRRVLLGTTGLFVLASGLLALSPPYAILLAARGAQGLAGGALLPMAIVALLRTLPPGHRALALALYTSASTVAPQLAAGIAGWLLDRWGWQALLLANLLPGLLAWAAGTYGLPREPLRVRPLLHTDRFGLLLLIGGLGLLACAFDQGNRLDWLHSPLIRALLAAGVVAVCGFAYHAASVRRDRLLDVELLSRRNILLGACGVVPFGLAAMGCGYVIPQYLVQVHGYGPADLEPVLWDAAWPQVISYGGAVLCLDRKWLGGPRRLLALGFVLVASGLLLAGLNISGTWLAGGLRAGQILQGLGLPLILLPLLYLYVGDLMPREGVHAALVFNVMRSLGGTIGLAGITTLDRLREQAWTSAILHHADTAATAFARVESLVVAAGPPSAAGDQAVHRLLSNPHLQAQILAHADTLTVLAIAMLAGAILAMCMRSYGSGHPSVNDRRKAKQARAVGEPPLTVVSSTRHRRSDHAESE
ncbi:MFS transporter [Serratia marcescens]|uniref:MFS transporter n=1 Tax=Gammaproteobacteria TaxID=1236 RepID=UPI00068B374F|nr:MULTISPECIES: MFS transporter [Gammaproteobacteria]EHF4985776.1 MFS transporter [Enterobacter hormaechei]EKY1502673.1 MFS transporter [Enterobacter cloacae]MBN5199890.1 MFS transporter [Serratia marcescens]VTM29464.1 multidrug resistance protein B [Klebsiella pneumoniae]HDT2670283.1 MFS transporter [Klebsiella pneumoniae subsp. pneumoniae]